VTPQSTADRLARIAVDSWRKRGAIGVGYVLEESETGWTYRITGLNERLMPILPMQTRPHPHAPAHENRHPRPVAGTSGGAPAPGCGSAAGRAGEGNSHG
jgi:hypothetical protein